ncbi:MAG TPA: hypothetical protein VF712_14285 [Thermoleophilaceae bacterium]|jgi:tetratricopeptide (TPR) repeat protein
MRWFLEKWGWVEPAERGVEDTGESKPILTSTGAPDLQQGAISRGWEDFNEAIRDWRLRVPAAILTAGFAVWGVLLPEDASPETRAALAVGGTLGGALLLGTLAFLALVVTAPTRQRNDARKAHTARERELADARAEGQRQLETAEAERERRLEEANTRHAEQLAEERTDAERRVRAAGIEADERVARVQEQLDEARARIEELEAEEDPDPRIALANRAQHRAAQLRGLCVKWEGRIATERRKRPWDVMGGHTEVAVTDALAEYEREQSQEARDLFNELVEARVIDAEHRNLIEGPDLLDDLREAAGHFQEAAKRLRELAEADPINVNRLQLLKEANRKGTLLLQAAPWSEGAPTNAEEAAEAWQRVWRRAVDWGIETWEMLRDHFGGRLEREFFGDHGWGDYALGRTGFAMLADKQRQDGMTVYTWMNNKLKVLAELLERFDREP